MSQSQAEFALSAMAGGSRTIAGGAPSFDQDHLQLLNAVLPRTPQKSFVEAKVNQGAALFSEAPISPTGLLAINATPPALAGDLDAGFGSALDEIIRILKASPNTNGTFSYGERLRPMTTPEVDGVERTLGG